MSNKKPIRATEWDGKTYGCSPGGKGKAPYAVRDFPCSFCGAPTGFLCHGISETPTWSVHCERDAAWRKAQKDAEVKP